MNRRAFLLTAAVAAPTASHAAEQGKKGRPTLCFFSKHLPDLKPDALGRTLHDIGFTGVDLTVRPKGHVLPERVAEDLPHAVEAIRSHGVSVPMITTEIISAADPKTRAILGAAARLRIPTFKLGYWKWGADPVDTIQKVGTELGAIVSLAKEYGVTAGMHNHAGYVGLAVWDTREMIRNLDPNYIGYYYDTQHARSEGGVGGWEVSLQLALANLKMVALKDFAWQQVNGRWAVVSCPLGQGMVEFPKIFAALAARRFTGPISIHQEYDAADPVAAAHKDREFASKLIDQAYAT